MCVTSEVISGGVCVSIEIDSCENNSSLIDFILIACSIHRCVPRYVLERYYVILTDNSIFYPIYVFSRNSKCLDYIPSYLTASIGSLPPCRLTPQTDCGVTFIRAFYLLARFD